MSVLKASPPVQTLQACIDAEKRQKHQLEKAFATLAGQEQLLNSAQDAKQCGMTFFGNVNVFQEKRVREVIDVQERTSTAVRAPQRDVNGTENAIGRPLKPNIGDSALHEAESHFREDNDSWYQFVISLMINENTVITVSCDANKMMRLFDLTWTVPEGSTIVIPPSVWNWVPPEARSTKTYTPKTPHDVWMFGSLMKAVLGSVRFISCSPNIFQEKNLYPALASLIADCMHNQSEKRPTMSYVTQHRDACSSVNENLTVRYSGRPSSGIHSNMTRY